MNNNIILSVAIITHPSRTSQLQALLEQIGTQIEYQVFMDDQNLGIWENAKRAWAAYNLDATHHMVLQDDIILSKNFFKIAEKLLAKINNGDSASFCDLLSSEMRIADQSNYHWVTTTKVRHGQCLVQPVGQINDFIHFCDWLIRPDYDHDDGRLEIYLYKHKRAIWHSVPSLVEHDDRGSVGGTPKASPYIGYKFIGRENEADPNVWSNLSVGFRPASLRIVDKWAVGDIDITNPTDFGDHEMFSKPTATIPYKEIIAQARIDRGATEPYYYTEEERSKALINPCGDVPCD